MQTDIRIVGGVSFFMTTKNLAGHVVIEEASAVAGQNSFINFRVIHGCNGSPTIGLRIEPPDGVAYLIPGHKSGWTVSVKRERITDANGQTLEWIRGISWSDGTIPPNSYDRFEFEVRFPITLEGRTFFKVIQVCEDGDIRYVDIPDGTALPWETPNPAPSINIMKQ